MTTRMNCRLNCLICHLSGFVDWWYGWCRCQVFLASPTTECVWYRSWGTSCISSKNEVSESFVGSSFGLFSLLLRHSLSQPCALGLSVTCPTRSLSPTQCLLLYGVSFPMTIHDCSGAKVLNKTGFANGTVSCIESRSSAALNGAMPPAPRAYPQPSLARLPIPA